MSMDVALRKLYLCGISMTVAVFAGCSSEEPASAPAETEQATASGAPESATATTAEPARSAEETKQERLKEQEVVKAAFASLSPEARLGARLFFENRLSNPGANLATSCRSCHVPPAASDGERRWTDTTALSVMPANDRGSKLETLRNTTTLLDAINERSYPSDGQFPTLDAYLSRKLLSEHMGWRPGEADQAKKEIQALLMNDDGSDPLADGTYAAQFKAVKDVDVESLSPDQAIASVVASMKDYLATVTTNNTAAYDAMMQQNRYPEALAGEGDTVIAYFGRLFESRIANHEGRVEVRFVAGFDEPSYQGFKAFFRMGPTWSSSTNGEEKNIGNCIACHIPPKFSDGRFHNIGTAQFEYDAIHGDGAFMNLKPAAPSDKTRARVDANDAEKADLGRWNVDPKEENFGAFKTPKLRDPAGTDPYMHNGRYATIEDAIRMHLKAADLAREGKLRNPDPELMKITGITETDIANMVKFFDKLNEVAPEEYRDFRISDMTIRQDPLGEATFSN